MREHLTQQQIERYHGRELAPSELIRLDEHLAACAECRSRLSLAEESSGRLLSLRQGLDSVSGTEHLDDERLAAYVDGALDEAAAEMASSHLKVCTRCELLASDLMVFKDEVAADLDQEYAPHAPASPSLAQKLYAFLRSLVPVNSSALAFGLGTAALLLAGLSLWLIIRSYRASVTQPEVVQTASPSPSTLPSPESTSSPQPNPSPAPEAGQQDLLALNDGARRVAFDGQGDVSGLDDLPAVYRQLVKTALVTGQAANRAALTGLGGTRGELRGAAERAAGFAPLDPVGVMILSSRPTLRWSRLEGATQYRVAVYDSSFNQVAASPPLSANFWTPPVSLPRGSLYSWQVTAMKDGAEIKSPTPPAPEARFKVLDGKRAGEIERARKIYQGSHLMLGVLYAEAGLLEEAARELAALVRLNPKSEVARKLLSDVQKAKVKRSK